MQCVRFFLLFFFKALNQLKMLYNFFVINFRVSVINENLHCTRPELFVGSARDQLT